MQYLHSYHKLANLTQGVPCVTDTEQPDKVAHCCVILMFCAEEPCCTRFIILDPPEFVKLTVAL